MDGQLLKNLDDRTSSIKFETSAMNIDIRRAREEMNEKAVDQEQKTKIEMETKTHGSIAPYNQKVKENKTHGARIVERMFKQVRRKAEPNKK